MKVCPARAEHCRVLTLVIDSGDFMHPAMLRRRLRSSQLLLRSSFASEGGGGRREREDSLTTLLSPRESDIACRFLDTIGAADLQVASSGCNRRLIKDTLELYEDPHQKCQCQVLRDLYVVQI